MPNDLANLLRRDHRELDGALVALSRPHVDVSEEFCDALDGARLGLLAHHEAQDRVLTAALHTITPTDTIHAVAAASAQEHMAIERAMSALILTAPHTVHWNQRVDQLRALLAEHEEHDETVLFPAIARAFSPEIRAALASAYATERLRQLAQLQPSSEFRPPTSGSKQPYAAAVL